MVIKNSQIGEVRKKCGSARALIPDSSPDHCDLGPSQARPRTCRALRPWHLDLVLEIIPPTSPYTKAMYRPPSPAIRFPATSALDLPPVAPQNFFGYEP